MLKHTPKTSNINDGRFMNHLVISNCCRHKSASWCKSSSGHWFWYVSGLLKRCWKAIFFILDLQDSKCSLPLWSASQSRYLNYNNDAHKQVGIKNNKHIKIWLLYFSVLHPISIYVKALRTTCEVLNMWHYKNIFHI